MKKLFLLFYWLILLFSLCGCSSIQDSLYDAAISAERMLSGLEESSINVDGYKMAYLERKGGGEVIILLHGFGADKDVWDRFVRYMPKDYRVIAFDLPGHGESFKDNDKPYTIDFMTQGLAGAVDALKLDRFHLVGNSMGGWVGMLYTARNPDRVITLGLFDTAGTKSPEPSDLARALEKGQSLLVPKTDESFFRLMKLGFYKEPFLPWPIRQVLARKAVKNAPFKEKMWNDIHGKQTDVLGILPDLRLPVLILWGADDRITDISVVQVYERYLPNAKTVIIPSCGHMPMVERPKETLDHYVTFLKEHAKLPARE
ncbi:MAG TPA: alpha/beta hydrolase [Desulfomonilia bacterium]|nr:alpha/beta hydrolase [Desulfomonilia bacterium]